MYRDCPPPAWLPARVDVPLTHLSRQNAVAITVELEPEGRPRRHAQGTQTQLLVHEVDVVMQAFAIVRLQIGFAGLLVMPGLAAAARLHSRKNAHHAGMLAALPQNLFDPVFFPKALLAAHKLDLDPIFGGDSLHV